MAVFASSEASASARSAVQVRSAYDLLSDPDARILYDMHGYEAAQDKSKRLRGREHVSEIKVSVVQHGMVRYGLRLHCIAWHGMTWNGMAWHGMTWHDLVWHGMA